MPSALHELIVSLLSDQPRRVVDLMRDALGRALPGFRELRLASKELPALAVPHQADMVVLLLDEAPVLAIVVEVQLDRDEDKPFTWPHYLTGIRTQFRCPACILVVTPYRGVAQRAAKPVSLGPPDMVFRPLVLGPSTIPVVTTQMVDRADPATALLSAVALPEQEQGVDAAVAALMATGHYEYQSEFAKRYVAQGRAEGKAEGRLEGKAEGILAVLDARRIAVAPELRERILGCKDLDLLDRWLRRAATVGDARQMFD